VLIYPYRIQFCRTIVCGRLLIEFAAVRIIKYFSLFCLAFRVQIAPCFI
jgi:hypothetical protein